MPRKQVRKSTKAPAKKPVSRRAPRRPLTPSLGQTMKSLPVDKRPMGKYHALTPEEKCYHCHQNGTIVINDETPLELYQKLGLY